jgi:hypothetical protein
MRSQTPITAATAGKFAEINVAKHKGTFESVNKDKQRMRECTKMP